MSARSRHLITLREEFMVLWIETLTGMSINRFVWSRFWAWVLLPHSTKKEPSLSLSMLFRVPAIAWKSFWIAKGDNFCRGRSSFADSTIKNLGLFFFFFFFFFSFLKFIYAVINEDEDDNWWCYGGPFSVWDYLTGPQTTLTVIIIPVLTRPGNRDTCSVGQVIRATLSKTHPWSGWSSTVWFQPSHWAHSTPSSG